MISPYQALTTYEQDDWRDFLEKCLLIDIFLPVLEEYKDPQTVKLVIKYIVFAYSAQSEHVVLGKEWLENKIQIFELLMFKPVKDFYDDVVNLMNPAVVKSIHNWLEFQDKPTFKQMQVLKDLKIEMQTSCLSRILKASAEVDYDQKFRNAEYASKLQEKIRELESELIQNNAKLKEAVREVKSAKITYNVGPETFSK